MTFFVEKKQTQRFVFQSEHPSSNTEFLVFFFAKFFQLHGTMGSQDFTPPVPVTDGLVLEERGAWMS